MVEFVYADTLKRHYSVFGEFYRLDIGQQRLLCRRRVELVHTGQGAAEPLALDIAKGSTPDAVAILMNPGGVRPSEDLDGFLNSLPLTHCYSRQDLTQSDTLHRLKPDNTQYQLMRLMQAMGWNHLRLVNLSDLCDANSQSFARRLADLLEQHPSLPHSIIDTARIADWQALVGDAMLAGSFAIAAWGAPSVLEPQARECIQRLPSIIGVEQAFPWYRFASPYRKDHKLEWLNTMLLKLTMPIAANSIGEKVNYSD